MIKKSIIAAALAVCTAATAGTMTAAELDKAAAHIRPRAAVVVEIDEAADAVTVEDTAGYIWSFYGVEDWNPGDGCLLELYDNGTEEITDDVILSATYTRFDLLPQ